MAAAEEEAAPLRREMVRVPLRRAAVLMLVGARELRALVAGTETSCFVLASDIHLLDEAQTTVEDLFNDPVPAELINAARRTVGRLSGALPPAAYLPIDQCRVHLARLDPVFTEANAHATRCAEILRLTDESPQCQRWRHLMDVGADQSTEAGKLLFKAAARAAAAYSTLLDLVTNWHLLFSLDRLTSLITAEDRLKDTMKLMDQTLAAMRQMIHVVTRQANEMSVILALNEAPA